MLGWFDEKGVKELLHIPLSKKVELIITMGYPISDEIRPKKRKEPDKIMNYNCY
jgi:nitroreductase